MESDRVISSSSDGINDAGQRMRSVQGRTSGPTRRSTKGQWTPEEDEILRKAVQRFKGKNWKKIAECFKDRTDVQCLHRWQKVLNPELVKGPWSKEEDEIIIELVNKFGPKKWSTIAQHLPGRIGKQCRERWHNHLNPAINKEAWTQEEEVALIRAHQIYGNRWAELTKFLPGRTDNAIKNHWNSSVKKKLDSYLASGLLEQFQGLPLVAHQNQMMASSSSRIQSSCDDSNPKGATEAEEISECSQESTVGGYPSAGATVIHTKDQLLLKEDSLLVKEQISSPVPCSEQYYTSLDDITFSIPEIPCEVGCSTKYPEQNFGHDAGTVANRDYQFNSRDLPNLSSLQTGHQSSGLSTHCIGSHDSQAVVNIPYQNSEELAVHNGDLAANAGKSDYMLIPDDECCRALFSEAMKDHCSSLANFAQGLNIVDLGGFPEYALSQSQNIQIPESGKTSDVSGTSTRSHPSACGMLSADDGAFVYGMDSNQLNSHSFGTPEKESNANAHNGFIYTNESADSPCNNGSAKKGLNVPSYISKESLKLVPVNSFGSASDVMVTNSCVDVKPNASSEQQDVGSQTPGSLCYEPPRFPGVDVPFFSCDLIQSGGDMQQEYSPLGIRQLMMSSMNCISPFRLWDSPSGDRSPDAVLKSAAKTFTGTPSILKKRNRDLLTPLSDRKNDKKLETDMTSGLTQDFSRLEVMFDECVAPRESLQSPSTNQKNSSGDFGRDQENLGSAFDDNQDKHKDCPAVSDDGALEKDASRSEVDTKPKTADTDSKMKGDPGAATENVEQAAVLVEHNMNDLLFSPDQVGIKPDRALYSIARTPKYHLRKSSGALSNLGIVSPGNPCSPAICKKNLESNSGAVNSVESIPSSAPLSNTVANAAIESYSIFGDTPFKRSIESPSAWKSPWFINSFIPGPRVDTEISIEDIGVFMSPGDRSYDALGLMKQLSEQTAGAYADAMEVLENETSEVAVGERNSNYPNDEKENNCVARDQQEKSELAANVLMERRVLDFSECGTPGKGTENAKTSSGISFSSPSSYLLKGCR